jgi:ribosomal protein RSM22 (predicted rRNA methylase)
VNDFPAELRAALDAELAAFEVAALVRTTRRLVDRYRSGTPADDPILRSPLDVAAYAAYRMPATYTAVRAALGRAVELLPDAAPRTHLDLGGGTGAALWAAADAFAGSFDQQTVWEQVPAAMELGQRLAACAPYPSVRDARWRRAALDADTDPPTADLVTASYVLGELPAVTREHLVRAIAARAQVIALVEPGTPAGFQRVLAARTSLLALGWSIVAPCPHQGGCPMADPSGGDWCHESVRLPRSALHRQLKDGSRGFEDEPYSFVVATARPSPTARNRVVRHPQTRKGMVSLRLCTETGTLADQVVSKRQGDAYRAARSTAWGDSWPPVT